MLRSTDVCPCRFSCMAGAWLYRGMYAVIAENVMVSRLQRRCSGHVPPIEEEEIVVA